jgi:hypothetical protein
VLGVNAFTILQKKHSPEKLLVNSVQTREPPSNTKECALIIQMSKRYLEELTADVVKKNGTTGEIERVHQAYAIYTQEKYSCQEENNVSSVLINN